jgi:hypothetical protein
MRCLISTIIRNRAAHVGTWANQIRTLAKVNPDVQFDLVVLENDSKDGTKEALHAVKPALEKSLNKVLFEIKDFDWPYFGSIKAKDRVQYLAKARNKTLELAENTFGLHTYNKVICIEPDISYDPVDISELIYSDLDIASGYSVLPLGMGVPDWIYDSWATRVQPNDVEYFGPKISELPYCLKVASTFNCFCVYNAEPLAKGVRFSHINPHTQSWDCDTTNICFLFAQNGYDQIGMHNISVLHKP